MARSWTAAVWQWGLSWLALGLICIGFLGKIPFILGVLLAGSIFIYDAIHKIFAFSPVLMAACRFFLVLMVRLLWPLFFILAVVAALALQTTLARFVPRGTVAVDLVLVDWNMPEMDGHEFLKRVRKDPQWAELRLMMVTTESELSQVTVALEAGADEYLMKPFDKEALLEKLILLGLDPNERAA